MFRAGCGLILIILFTYRAGFLTFYNEHRPSLVTILKPLCRDIKALTDMCRFVQGINDPHIPERVGYR